VAKDTRRKLAAILAADVVGYSRLMGEDEAGTLDVLRVHREGLIEPKIAEHEGRIVKLMGDGVLAEFPSAVEAVQCGVEIQHALAQRNADIPEDKRMAYRIGINLGDIIVEGDDIYGDGVNIAARLEGLAEPGGVCVSGKVRDELRGKFDLGFDDLGAQSVKNIAEPVRVYRVTAEQLTLSAAPSSKPLPLPDKPSIAVLPFDNMSGDPEQEYFADGIAEDIITALSKFRWFFVIARNSSFTYKGKSVDVKQVAEEAWRPLRVGRQRAQGRQPGPDQRAVDRRRDRQPRLGGTLRPRACRHLRFAGRDDGDNRRRDRAGTRRCRARPRQTEAARQPRRLRSLPTGALALLALYQGRHRRGGKAVSKFHRSGPWFRPSLRGHRVPPQFSRGLWLDGYA
jgi:class 3 adenylate cyclase